MWDPIGAGAGILLLKHKYNRQYRYKYKFNRLFPMIVRLLQKPIINVNLAEETVVRTLLIISIAMKRTYSAGIAVIAALIAAASVSCRKTAAPGDNPDPGPDDGKTPELSTEVHAGGYYNGDLYATGSDNFILYIADNPVLFEDNAFTGEGTALLVDFNAPATGSPVLSAGTYKALLSEPGEGESQDYTFLPGTDLGSWGIMGTFIYSYRSGSSAPEYLMVDDGTVEVSLSGDIYTVVAEVTASGEEYTFSYTGNITFGKPGEGGDPGDGYDEVVLDRLTQGTMEYYGQAYGDTGTDYANWTVYLAESTYDLGSLTGSGNVLQMEINTAADQTEAIPEGTYTVFPEIAPESFVPYSIVPAFVQDGYAYGTWYFGFGESGTENSFGATSGSAEVSRDGDIYTIEFEFVDDELGGRFSGTYRGELQYYDWTESALASVQESSSRRCGKRLPVYRKAAGRI